MARVDKKVQAILAKGLPLRQAQTISTPRITNNATPQMVKTGFCVSRRRPTGPSAAMLKNGKLLEIVDEERVGTEYESEWEQSGEYGRRAMQCGENLTKLLYYFGISSPLDVVWSHATNSKIKLERCVCVCGVSVLD